VRVRLQRGFAGVASTHYGDAGADILADAGAASGVAPLRTRAPEEESERAVWGMRRMLLRRRMLAAGDRRRRVGTGIACALLARDIDGRRQAWRFAWRVDFCVAYLTCTCRSHVRSASLRRINKTAWARRRGAQHQPLLGITWNAVGALFYSCWPAWARGICCATLACRFWMARRRRSADKANVLCRSGDGCCLPSYVAAAT